jgi:hypothetical protein
MPRLWWTLLPTNPEEGDGISHNNSNTFLLLPIPPSPQSMTRMDTGPRVTLLLKRAAEWVQPDSSTRLRPPRVSYRKIRTKDTSRSPRETPRRVTNRPPRWHSTGIVFPIAFLTPILQRRRERLRESRRRVP